MQAWKYVNVYVCVQAAVYVFVQVYAYMFMYAAYICKRHSPILMHNNILLAQLWYLQLPINHPCPVKCFQALFTMALVVDIGGLLYLEQGFEVITQDSCP